MKFLKPLLKSLLIWLAAVVIFTVEDDSLRGIGINPKLRFLLFFMIMFIGMIWTIAANAESFSKAATAMQHPFRAMDEVFGAKSKVLQNKNETD